MCRAMARWRINVLDYVYVFLPVQVYRLCQILTWQLTHCDMVSLPASGLVYMLPVSQAPSLPELLSISH